MVTVGIRELKQQASELVRMVREEQQVILITYHGKVVAKMTPTEPQKLAAESEDAWKTLEELALRISSSWPDDVPATEALSDSRA
jgi:prevent-host-death family protein